MIVRTQNFVRSMKRGLGEPNVLSSAQHAAASDAASAEFQSLHTTTPCQCIVTSANSPVLFSNTIFARRFTHCPLNRHFCSLKPLVAAASLLSICAGGRALVMQARWGDEG